MEAAFFQWIGWKISFTALPVTYPENALVVNTSLRRRKKKAAVWMCFVSNFVEEQLALRFWRASPLLSQPVISRTAMGGRLGLRDKLIGFCFFWTVLLLIDA